MIVRCLILLHLSLAAITIDYLSFKSPLLPDHSDKFYTLGDAVPQRKLVRLHPPKQFSTGALVSSNQINLTSYELQIVFNSGSGGSLENVGLSIWLTNLTYHIGTLYGLSSDFQGIGIFVDISKESLYLTESYKDLDISKIMSSPSCNLVTKNKQTTLHIKVKENKIQVWVKEKKLRKCVEAKIQEIDNPIFGISSHSGNTTTTVFDIVQITTLDLNGSELTEEALQLLENQFYSDVVALETKSFDLVEQITNITQSSEYQEILQITSTIRQRAGSITSKLSELQNQISTLHLDDSFTNISNDEITNLRDAFAKIYTKIESIIIYIDSKKIISEISNTIEKQYKNMSIHGEVLKRELDISENNLKNFETIFEVDNRVFYLHIGLLIIVLFSLLVCFKVSKTKKVHRIV
ncbi:hypothetical protein SteCoe_24682 [Stentor coeruleus]|uniref:L-type lectin-like domain-containing protein n=1 Tax=Stentor coeruleus TaxID=5963 RepID=A0A1R2BGZ2_9CILI|nr:hypothetical protein SteCoe_24682 [Stentor coeruleus]